MGSSRQIPSLASRTWSCLGYVHPPTEVIAPIQLAPAMTIAPIAATDDGTQIWKITHNGVDTHPIHFHLFDVQLINRVAWDGAHAAARAE